MNVYHKAKKTWALDLAYFPDESVLYAVDSGDGEHIAAIVSFRMDGSVVVESGAKDVLVYEGYDPYEHRNTWLPDGRIIIT
jgi:hypothetical protein